LLTLISTNSNLSYSTAVVAKILNNGWLITACYIFALSQLHIGPSVGYYRILLSEYGLYLLSLWLRYSGYAA